MKKNTNISINKKIGKRFSKLISEFEDTKKAFAEDVGYEPETISRYCSGTYRLTEDFISLCSSRWGVREEYILCKDDYKTDADLLNALDNKDHTAFLKQKEYLETLGFKINIKFELQCNKSSLFKYIDTMKDYLTDESYNNFINDHNSKNDNITPCEDNYLEHYRNYFHEHITVQLKKPLSQELKQKIFLNYDRKNTSLESDIPFDSIDSFSIPYQESMLKSNCELNVSYTTYYKNKYIGDFSLRDMQELFKSIDSYTKCTIENFITFKPKTLHKFLEY